MTRDEIEFVRHSIETFLSEGLEPSLRFFAPDGEFHSRFGAIEGGHVYKGHDGVRKYIADINDAWETYDRNLEDLVDAGDSVLAIVNIKARARASGAEVERRIGLAYWLRDGVIVRMISYPSVEEARETLGVG